MFSLTTPECCNWADTSLSWRYGRPYVKNIPHVCLTLCMSRPKMVSNACERRWQFFNNYETRRLAGGPFDGALLTSHWVHHYTLTLFHPSSVSMGHCCCLIHLIPWLSIPRASGRKGQCFPCAHLKFIMSFKMRRQPGSRNGLCKGHQAKRPRRARADLHVHIIIISLKL